MSTGKTFENISLTLPIMLAYIPLGAIFGFLMVNQGITWYWPPVFSFIIFAGAMQFAVVGLLATGASLIDIALATLLINFRHIFYGFSLVGLLPEKYLKRIYFVLCITDENYSLLTSKKINHTSNNALVLMAINHSYWVLGTLIGVALTQNLPMQLTGIDFSLTALFTVLAIEQIKANKDKRILILIVISIVLALLLFKTTFLLAAASIFIGLLLLLNRKAIFVPNKAEG